jgi:hypothetical protein
MSVACAAMFFFEPTDTALATASAARPVAEWWAAGLVAAALSLTAMTRQRWLSALALPGSAVLATVALTNPARGALGAALISGVLSLGISGAGLLRGARRRGRHERWS